MSYDLFFLVGPGREPIPRYEFIAYFAGRPHYSIEGDKAFYGNEDTRGAFWFDWAEIGLDDEPDEDDGDLPPDDELGPAGVAFEMNYNRPFWFAEEAEPEVRAFIDAFELRVEDPQADGMGRGPYGSRGFLDGWSAGNRFALRVLRAQGAPEPPMLPADTIRRVRSWNAAREGLHDALGNSVFVPHIFYLLDGGAICTFITWGWDIPTTIPAVDRVIIGRPPSGFLARLRRGAEFSMIHGTSVPVVEPVHPWAGGDYRMSPSMTDPGVRELFYRWTPQTTPDRILDEEVFEMEAYRAATAAGDGTARASTTHGDDLGSADATS